MIHVLQNDVLRLKVSTAGAEMQSIENLATGFEYLWHGDPKFWRRRSPVLFPIVGSVAGGSFTVDGVTYPMGQHGFARDMEFEPVDTDADDELWYRLESTPETLEKYPRRFRLEVGYRLVGERITVMWRVTNLDGREMHFQIGAHPAFMIPGFNPADTVRGYLAIDNPAPVTEIIETGGCVGPRTRQLQLDSDGMLPLEASTFADDALIIGGSSVRRVSLLDRDRRPVLTLLFHTPYVGLWAPAPDAPFVCIEPWYGRADSVGFTGEFRDRLAVNTLAPGATFTASYLIAIDNA